jgi:hypothetical protein
VKLLVRAHLQRQPVPDDSMLSHGWRRQHVLPELEAVLHGKRAVRITNLRADAPLAYDD